MYIYTHSLDAREAEEWVCASIVGERVNVVVKAEFLV